MNSNSQFVTIATLTIVTIATLPLFSDPEMVMNTGLADLTDIAVDWIGRNVYYIDGYLGILGKVLPSRPFLNKHNSEDSTSAHDPESVFEN